MVKKSKGNPTAGNVPAAPPVPASATVRTPRPEELKKAIAEEKAKLTRTLDILAKN